MGFSITLMENRNQGIELPPSKKGLANRGKGRDHVLGIIYVEEAEGLSSTKKEKKEGNSPIN